jgi:hypothetical protein
MLVSSTVIEIQILLIDQILDHFVCHIVIAQPKCELQNVMQTSCNCLNRVVKRVLEMMLLNIV